MDIQELIKSYKEANSKLKKTSYDSSNLEFLKKKYMEKILGFKQAFVFLDNFLAELENHDYIKKSNSCSSEYKDGEVILYDYIQKSFFTYSNDIVETVFLKTYTEKHFDLNNNELYVMLCNVVSKAIKETELKLVTGFMDQGNIVNWFLFSLRNQARKNFVNKFSFKISINNIPDVFFDASEEKHKDFMECFFLKLKEEKIVFVENDFYGFFDLKNAIKLIYGNFDLFWFNRPEKEFIFITQFELNDLTLKKLIDNEINYFDDSFISMDIYVNKIKTNNIIFCYVISSMFCHIAVHNHSFVNSLYSDYFFEII